MNPNFESGGTSILDHRSGGGVQVDGVAGDPTAFVAPNRVLTEVGRARRVGEKAFVYV